MFSRKQQGFMLMVITKEIYILMIFFPERFDRKRKYALGKNIWKMKYSKNLQELGLTLNDEDLKKITQRIIELGDRKERVTAEDLLL